MFCRHLSLIADGALRCAPSAPLTRLFLRGQPVTQRTALVGAVIADELSLALAARAVFKGHKVEDKKLILYFRFLNKPAVESRLVGKLQRAGLAGALRHIGNGHYLMAVAIPAPGVLVQ